MRVARAVTIMIDCTGSEVIRVCRVNLVAKVMTTIRVMYCSCFVFRVVLNMNIIWFIRVMTFVSAISGCLDYAGAYIGYPGRSCGCHPGHCG